MRKGIGPRALGSPLKQTMSKKKEPIAFNKELKPLPGRKVGNLEKMPVTAKKEYLPTTYSEPQGKKDDPNVFTDIYNAATGEYYDSSYNPARAKQYEKNAIDKYGSLEASREATRKSYPYLTKDKKLQKPIIRGGNRLKK